MGTNTGMQMSHRGLAAIFVVIFLFGGAVGYIVRDVRADEQVKAAAVDARQDVEQTATSLMQRAREASATLAGGLSAAAESTKAAVGAAGSSKHEAAAPSSDSTTTPTKETSHGEKK